MCYNAESSLKTSILSGISIVYLLSSGIPHYQWIGVILIGWCGMQFAEYLLWSTNPAKKCTTMNTVVTMTLIPLVLLFQPLGSLFGSLFVTPWSQSDETRKNVLLFYPLLMLGCVWYSHFNDITKTCTVVTNQYHLQWLTSMKTTRSSPYIWAVLIILPIILYWDKSWVFMGVLILMPIFGFCYGQFTDSHASLWCYYTSYTSVIGAFALMCAQFGFGDALNAKLM